MSNIYIQEPPTSGKVVLYTTVGEIEIELWSKETPLACRNFVQLCMENYYDNTIFHRLVPNFVVQGGDPSGTGMGGESVYGEPFRDEFHSRLRFIRRGLVATANNGDKNANESQFFFTLDATPELQNKHTIFGKVVGDTLFNMLKLGESDVDANERPVFLNRVLRTEVIRNPFEDITPRKIEKTIETTDTVVSKSKATKDFGLLSFGDEAEEDEEETSAVPTALKTKSKSSHDHAADPLLSTEVTQLVTDDSREAVNETVSSVRQRLKEASLTQNKSEIETRTSDVPSSKADGLRKQALALQLELTKPRDAPARVIEAPAKPDVPSSPAVEEYRSQMDVYEARRRKKGANREDSALERLKNFKGVLSAVRKPGAVTAAQPVVEREDGEDIDDDNDNDPGWMKHLLSFEAETKLALDANLKNEADWYDIQDPRNPINKRKREAGQDKIKKQKS